MKEPRRREGVKMIEEAKRSTRGLIMTEGKGVPGAKLSYRVQSLLPFVPM